MQPLLERFPGLEGFPRVDLGVRPTPTEEIELDGFAIAVKRDDLSTPVYGGNKPRALEFLLAPRPRRVMTFSSLLAHHAYATAVHAAGLGLKTDVVLVRRGRESEVTELTEALAARFCVVPGVTAALARALAWWRPGTRIVPPGGACARGAVGTLAAVFELEQLPRRIYVPLGTGVTASGLLAGLMLREAVTEVVAVRVADRVAGLRALVWGRALRAAALLRRFDPQVPRAAVGGVSLRVVSAAGEYGQDTSSARATVERLGAVGLTLETTYTGKTMEVLLRERTPGALFWHTYSRPKALRTAEERGFWKVTPM